MMNDTLIKILQSTNNASVIKIYLYTQIFLENYPDTKIIINDSWNREYLCYLSNATNISEKNLYRYLKILVSNNLLVEKGGIEKLQTSLNYNINFYEDCVNPKSELYDSSIKPEYVYAYYFPQDKKLAELEGKNKWPVKIGKTTNDPGYRIKQQLSESTLNQPIICFVACVSNCTYYETELHRFYSNQHSKIQGDNGANEWFYINPEELEEIIFLLASPKENKIETFQTKSSLVKNSHDKLLSAQHILNISKIIPPNSLKIYLTLTCYSKALSQSEISTLTDITLSNLPKYLIPLLKNKLIIKENNLFIINPEYT